MKRFLYLIIALSIFLTSAPANADLISPQIIRNLFPES